jgi:hypothetical protein
MADSLPVKRSGERVQDEINQQNSPITQFGQLWCKMNSEVAVIAVAAVGGPLCHSFMI